MPGCSNANSADSHHLLAIPHDIEKKKRRNDGFDTGYLPTTDVLVVGAGPTGLTLACELMRRGIRCRIIEQADAPMPLARTLGIQSRTLEVFERMGIVAQVLRQAARVDGNNFYAGTKRLVHMDFGLLAKDHSIPYPYGASLPQTTTERIFTELLQASGADIEWSSELVDFWQEDDAVVALLKHPHDGSDETIRARFLVGCDGAHSIVRKTLGFPFEGTTYEGETLHADVELDWKKSHHEIHRWWSGFGQLDTVPMPGEQRWRLAAFVPAASSQEVPRASRELFQRFLHERARENTAIARNPTSLANFTINRRAVTQMR